MHISTIGRILGILLMLFSFTMLPPLLVSSWYDDQQFGAFMNAFWLTLGAGILVWLPFKGKKRELRVRDGFVVTVLFWLGDDSLDHQATWEFLDRRIDNVMQFEKVKAQILKNPLLKPLLAGPEWLAAQIKPPKSRDDLPGTSG